MSDKNLGQQKNVKFYMKVGETAVEMSALLMLTYGKYAMKKFECFCLP
jgi:hypothetical protein